ncbi:MAG: hypothetical protein ACRD9L_26440, partial [Bryobacteraceae bacterium]
MRSQRYKVTNVMLQYYIHDGPGAFRFALAGVLTEPDVRRLEQDWHTACSSMGDRTLIVDLSNLAGIDEPGRELLRTWHKGGAQFIAKSDEARRLAESITGHAVSQAPGRMGPVRRLQGLSLLAAAILLWIPANAGGASLPADTVIGSPSQALAHYLELSVRHDPLDQSSTVAVDIQASLPSLQKTGHLAAIRRPATAELASSPNYQVLRVEGDATVRQQVIARYLSAERQAGSLPASSVAVSAANYKFHYIAT